MSQDYVYVPIWLLVLLVFLASGAVQYAMIAAVKLTLRLTAERTAKTEPEKPAIVLLDEYRRAKSD